MKCDDLRKRLLALERPDRPAADLRSHLARCEACRRLQSRLVGLERAVPRIPVPASQRRVAFVASLLDPTPQPQPADDHSLDPPVVATTLSIPRAPQRGDRFQRRDRGLRKLALATGLAAGLVLFALCWSVWQKVEAVNEQRTAARFVPRKPTAADPLLASLMKRDVTLARAHTVRERVEALAGIADDLQGEICTVARAMASKDLDELAQLYERVLREGLLRQAAQLSPQEKPAILEPLAGRLSLAAGQLEEISRATDLRAEAVEPMRRLMLTARDVSVRLHDMAGKA
jgi:hypothetical protein